MRPTTIHVRINRVVVDANVTSADPRALHQSIQAELALLLSGESASRGAPPQDRPSLAATIAAGIAARLETTIRGPSASPLAAASIGGGSNG
jgi:hypothetical protein